MRIPARWRAVLLAVSLGAAMNAPAQAPATTEATLKAGFVYNFGKFTEWPPGALPPGPVFVCVLGTEPANVVASTIEGRQLQSHPIVVKRNPRGDELKTCQILYLTELDERRQAEVLRSVRNLPILTIGDAEGFSEVGGMIGFGSTAGRVSFEINNEAAHAAGLKFSSQLLKLATIVRGRAP